MESKTVTDSDLLAIAKECAAWDSNEETKAAIASWIAENDTAQITKAFEKRLAFGTAGLRGEMGPGLSRMNELTVMQASQGLCQYLMNTFGAEEAKAAGVVIGFDHRQRGSLTSKRFAEITAAAFLQKGFKVYMFKEFVPTPFVPFGVSHLKAVAGVMVTASHNPKQDNGYKVYWANACQIIPPHDAGIVECIESNKAPWAQYEPATVWDHAAYEDPTASVKEAYFSSIKTKLCSTEASNSGSNPIVYTAMHGVGCPFVLEAFDQFSLPKPLLVSRQVDPDPEFSTVKFPNPEEGKGALALAIETANAHNASIILANDPDADRLAVAEKEPNGQWRVFTGNEIAAMLGHWQFRQYKARQGDVSNAAMVASTVSSKFLKAMAEKEGFTFAETLTGFKWIGNKCIDLRKEGKEVLFSFEEAIGFCVGDVVCDKDGVSAAAVFAELCNSLYSKGSTCSDYLTELAQSYGYFVEQNSYVFCHDPSITSTIFKRIVNEGHYWLKVGRFKIANVRDLMTPGLDTSRPDMSTDLPVSSSSFMITFKFHNGAVLTLRTSGTEPKIKFYSEMSGSDPAAVRAELFELVESVVTDMIQPGKHGLKRAGEQ